MVKFLLNSSEKLATHDDSFQSHEKFAPQFFIKRRENNTSFTRETNGEYSSKWNNFAAKNSCSSFELNCYAEEPKRNPLSIKQKSLTEYSNTYRRSSSVDCGPLEAESYHCPDITPQDKEEKGNCFAKSICKENNTYVSSFLSMTDISYRNEIDGDNNGTIAPCNTIPLPGVNLKPISDIDASKIDVLDIVSRDRQYDDNDECKELDSIYICKNECDYPDEGNYDLNKEPSEEHTNFSLSSVGRVYSTIMEEPEDEHIRIPYIDNSTPLGSLVMDSDTNADTVKNSHSTLSCLDVFDSLLTPPPEAEMWRLSGTSCNTGTSSNTDISEDTVAQNMSELSSVNSYLSDFAIYEGEEKNIDQIICEYDDLAERTPKASPLINRKKKSKNINDAISQLEDIEFTAQNLLREKLYKDKFVVCQKRRLHLTDNNDEHIRTEKVTKSKNPNKRKKKSSKSRDPDKDKRPVYWLKPDNIKPYISRESYNEDSANTPENTLKKSYQEGDLNDYLDQLDNANENNGFLSDDNLDTLNYINGSISHNNDSNKIKEKSNKIEHNTNICQVHSKAELLKDIDHFLEIDKVDDTNNNPNRFDTFEQMENQINNVNVKLVYNDNHNIIEGQDANTADKGKHKNDISIEKEAKYVKNINLGEDSIDLSNSPAVPLNKIPKVKKKGVKNKKSKKPDKPTAKSGESSIDSLCASNIKEISDSSNALDSSSKIKSSSQVSSSIDDIMNFPEVSKIRNVSLQKDSPALDCRSRKNKKGNLIDNKRNETMLADCASACNKIPDKKGKNTTSVMSKSKQTSNDERNNRFFKGIKQDANSYQSEPYNSIPSNQKIDEFHFATNDNVEKNEEDLITDISNNLWNNYSFGENNSIFIPGRFLPLPPIPEALSDDYSIPQTPDTTSIYFDNPQTNQITYQESISNKNEALLLDTENKSITKSENGFIIDNIFRKKSGTVKNIINKFENPIFGVSSCPRGICMQSDNKNDSSSVKDNGGSSLISTKDNDYSYKIDDLSYYCDETMKITEVMVNEFNANINKKEKCKENQNKYNNTNSTNLPVRFKSQSEFNVIHPSSELILAPARGNSSFKNKLNKNNGRTVMPSEPQLPTPPIVYMDEFHKESNFTLNDEKMSLEVPIQYNQKMAHVDVTELNSVLQENNNTHRRMLNDVYEKFDFALAGIDEPSLLDEIQQLLGFDVNRAQAETRVGEDTLTTHTQKSSLISDQKCAQFECDYSSSLQTENKSAPAPPKRIPTTDFAEKLPADVSIQHQFSPSAANSLEIHLNTSSTPPIPPKPDYIQITERSTSAAQEVHSFGIQTGGVWSPGTAPAGHSGPSKLETPELPSFRDVPSVWTPGRGGSASPGPNKEYRKITFDGPTVPKRAHQQTTRDLQPRPEESFAWQGKGVELNKFQSNLPRAPNPTVTLLQKKRDDDGHFTEGLIQDHKPDYIKPDDVSHYGPGDKLYTIKKEYESEDEEFGHRKFAVLGPRKTVGVGPTTREGMPISLKTGVKSEHQGEWYRRMFDSLHKVKDDDYVIIKYKVPKDSNTKYNSSKVRYGGYTSEPDYDSDAGVTRYAKYDRSKNEFEFENAETSTARKTKRYVHQPGRIENYVPGFSSLSERELKENPEADVKLEITTAKPSRQTFQGARRLGSGYKESGYDSDSTLVFKKREGSRHQIPDPGKTSEIYREIQKGGDIPLSGLQRPAPRSKALPHNKYETSEVNIHYRTPIRIERKDFISDEELARRQEEHMKKVYEQERRKKYLSELEDIERRRHTDNFTPLQKSPIPLNRYDDEVYGGLRGFRTPDPRQMAKALFGFHAQNKRELNFNKGDIITIRRHIDKNWMEGEYKGNMGIFPSNYVEILPYENFKTVTRKAAEGQARVRFNFQAQTPLEMSLTKGEIIILTRRVDGNWFEGRVSARKGIFPVSYVDILQEPFGRDTSPAQDTLTRPALPPAHLLFNGTSSVNSPYSTLGNHGNQTDTKASLSQLTVNTQQEPTEYRALYNYKPQNDDELELLEGDAVMVMEKCDDGWFVGTSQRTNLFGTFPGNYVEKK